MMINEPVNSPEDKNKIIELTLPLDAAFISAARLTSSSIANRMGFSIEEVEDVKTAVSEACTLIIEKAEYSVDPFKLKFKIQPDCLLIYLETNALDFESYENETPLLLIKALMTEIKIKTAKQRSSMTLIKNHTAFSI